MKILVTAFEPFGKRSVNASLTVMEGLSTEFGDLEVIREVLPVDYRKAPRKLIELLNTIQPDAVICLGEAGGCDSVRLEFVAINWMDFGIPDNSGQTVEDKIILEGGQNAYFSTLPLRRFEKDLEKENIPVTLSMTAGTYLCNQTFYTLMNYLDDHQSDIPAGFIHLPAETVGSEEPGIKCELTLCIKGINLILQSLLD